MKRFIILLCFCTAALHGASVHFRIDTSPAMQEVLMSAFYDFLNTLPASERPARFAVGKSVKGQTVKPVLEIAADLPKTAMPYAVNGTIFAVSRRNPIKKLSRVQADSILAGKLTHWEEENGKKKAVIFCIYTPVQRETPYHDRHLAGHPVQTKNHFRDLELLTRYVNNSKDAIAILPIRCFNLQELKLLAPDNIPCSLENVMNGKYPYAAIYRIRWNKNDPLANKLAEYLLSPRVKLRIHQLGDMPLRPNQK